MEFVVAFSLLSCLSLSFCVCHCCGELKQSIFHECKHTHSFCHFIFVVYRNERIIMGSRMSRWAHTRIRHTYAHRERESTPAMKMTLELTFAGKHPMQIFNPYIYSIKWKMNDKHTHEWRSNAPIPSLHSLWLITCTIYRIMSWIWVMFVSHLFFFSLSLR